MRPCASRVLVERNKTLDANISERRRVYRGSNRNLEREREVFKEKEKKESEAGAWKERNPVESWERAGKLLGNRSGVVLSSV